jgi:tetratricopeptide (TPR) repeat protein
MMNKKMILLVILFLTAASAFSLDFSLRPGGFVFIPAGPGNEAAGGYERFDIGGGGELGFDLDLTGLWPNPLGKNRGFLPGLGYTAGIEGGLAFNPYKQPASGNAQLYSFGGTLGFYYFPLSRLFTRLDGGMGVYRGVIEEGRGEPALWWRAGGGAGFRFTPVFTLAASGGWRQFQSPAGVFSSGLYAGLALHVAFETSGGAAGEGAAAIFTQDEGVYPAFLSLYQQNPAGIVTIRNNENAEIRDVRVGFWAAGYTAGEFPCGTVPLVAKGRSAELPLYADFSPELLRFTDTGRVLGEVVIRYRFLGKEKQSVRTVSVRVHNRNVFIERSEEGRSEAGTVDWRSLAAFVSPSSPDILEYSKHIIGLARSARRTGLNQNMQAAVWLFEGLRAAGIRLNDTHSAAGEAQYPAETLGFRTGNRRDLGLLFAAALEASGIPAAFVPLESEQGSGDFVVACYLGVDQAGAELLFNGLDRVLVIDDQVWMPLSMSAFNDGFMAAWDGGVEVLNGVFAEGGGADFIMLEDAWGTYPPAPLPAQGGAAVRAGGGELAGIAGSVMGRYVGREIESLVQNIQRQIRAGPPPAGLPLASLHNRLGILLVRAGRAAEAKAAYEQAAGMGSVPAMTNRGNLALIEKDYAAAERWFRQALAREPENAAAKRGLTKTSAYRGLQ